MTDSMGQSPASHEGTYLEPDERTEEVVNPVIHTYGRLIRPDCDRCGTNLGGGDCPKCGGI